MQSLYVMLMFGAPLPARAGDSWANVRPGLDYLHRTTSEPQDIYAVRVDLTVPNVGLHASADAMYTERHVTTPTFAANAGVTVAINGDWSDTTTPVGLAISDGWPWHSHIPDDTLGGVWGYFACTATKTCTIDAELPLDQAWWFTNPTLPPYRYFQAIGANGVILVADGAAQSGCYDSSDNPRSAICLDVTGTILWLVVVDGRTGSAAGMTCDETRALLLDLGCWDGAMLDGGGSSTLVIEGDVKNNPSDGSPRTVANHLGIVYSDAIDPSCGVANGRWCSGTVIGACQGGRFLGSGDCAAYGASCEEDGDYAYCVDYRCPGASGTGGECLDATTYAGCTDGAYGTGDCGVFGLVCGTDAGGAACMDPRCTAGPHSGFCTEDGVYASCTDGVYGGEQGCASLGLVCDPSAGCVDPPTDSGGGSDSDSASDSASNSGIDTGEDADDGPGAATRVKDAEGCGCTSAPPTGSLLAAVTIAVVGLTRRRRGSSDRRACRRRLTDDGSPSHMPG